MAGGSYVSVTGTAAPSIMSHLHLHRGLARRRSHAHPENYDEENDPIPDEQEEGPAPVKIRHVFEGIFHSSHHDHTHHSQQADIEHYIHDKSFRRRLFLLSLSNSDFGIRVHLIRSLLFVFGCVLYIAEATYYDYWGEKIDLSEFNSTTERELRKLVYFVWYTDKPIALWLLQVCIGFVSLLGAFLHLYTRVTNFSCRGFVKEVHHTVFIQFFIGFLYCFTLLYPPILKNLFIPMFLLCWPGRHALSAAIIQSASKQLGIGPKTFVIRAIHLAVFLICFTFTWVCLLHRVELVNSHLNFFDTIWFVLVTLSSVGYGDISPDHYTGKLLVMLFIILGFIVILPQLEELYHTFQLQRRLHNSVSYSDSHKHVILCSPELKPMVLRDFLAEFFSDPKNLDMHCVVLVEKELSPFIRVYLSHPIWSSRITILIGSPMRRPDLARARADTAIACFIHTSRSAPDPETADQHTVISAWAVKNFAPECKLYVHILKPETRMHLDLADQVMCEGEMKLALMANHVNCPGISTLVTLLLHTFKTERHDLSSPDYRLYDMCSSCEVYDSRVGDSKYFHFFIGKNFLFASVVAYRRYQVTLLGVKPKDSRDILLNPGLHYILEEDDICYYMGFTREEYSKVRETPPSAIRTAMWQMCANVALLSISIAGINAEQLGVEPGAEPDKEEEKESVDGGYVEEEKEEREEEEVKTEMEKVPSNVSHTTCVRFQLGGGSGDEEGPEPHSSCPTSCDPSCDPSMDSTYAVVKRGLKLLKFHSKMDFHANPVVKVHFCTPTPILTPEEQGSTFDLRTSKPDDMKLMEEGQGGLLKPPTNPMMMTPPSQIMITPPTRSRRRSLRRSVSESSLSGIMAEIMAESPTKNKGIMYSSQLSLVGSKGDSLGQDSHAHLFPPLAKVIRRMSSWNTHRPSVGTVDFRGSEEVVLDLEDVDEERELEELEDGRCGGDEEEEESEDEVTIAPKNPTERPLTPTTPCASHKFVKGCLPRVPYCGCGPERFHLLPERRPHHILHIDNEPSEEPDCVLEEKVGVSHRWKRGGVIVYSEEGTEDLYNLILPLRAHYLHTAELRHILLLLGNEPSPSFLDLISALPMVHYMRGQVGDLDTWLRAGVLVCDCVIITGGKRPSHEEEHMVDAAHIMAAQKVIKLFPHVNVMTELHYRYNMKFLQPDNYVMYGGSNRADHLSYLFQPQFAGGRTFCASMLDTMLYQSHFKPYIVDLVRRLLGCQQVNDSAYLWKLEISEDLLQLQTYDRLFQKVVTVHHCVPLGLYRTVPLPSCPVFQKYYAERVALDSESQYSAYLRSRLEMMGETVDREMEILLDKCRLVPTQSFVLANPPPKTHLQEGDILLTLRPHHRPLHNNQHPPLSLSILPDQDDDSGVHHPSLPTLTSSSPPTLHSSSPLTFSSSSPPTSSPPTQPSTPNTITVTVECH